MVGELQYFVGTEFKKMGKTVLPQSMGIKELQSWKI
jgi:hypothetical protein